MCVHACLCVCVFACACACAVRACVLDFQLVLKYVSIHHKRLHVKLYFFLFNLIPVYSENTYLLVPRYNHRLYIRAGNADFQRYCFQLFLQNLKMLRQVTHLNC